MTRYGFGPNKENFNQQENFPVIWARKVSHYLLVDDVRQLLYHFFEVGLQALVVLKLVLFDQTLVYVQSHTASLDKTPAIIQDKITHLITTLDDYL